MVILHIVHRIISDFLYPSTQAERERFYVYDINVQVHYSWGREEEKEEQEVDDRCSICFIRLGAEKKMFHWQQPRFSFVLDYWIDDIWSSITIIPPPPPKLLKWEKAGCFFFLRFDGLTEGHYACLIAPPLSDLIHLGGLVKSLSN